MSVTCTHSIMAAGAAPREVSWQVKDEARAGGGVGGGTAAVVVFVLWQQGFSKDSPPLRKLLATLFCRRRHLPFGFYKSLRPHTAPPLPLHTSTFTLLTLLIPPQQC